MAAGRCGVDVGPSRRLDKRAAISTLRRPPRDAAVCHVVVVGRADLDTFSRLHDIGGCRRVHVFIFLPVRSCFGHWVSTHAHFCVCACVRAWWTVGQWPRKSIVSCHRVRAVYGLDIVSISLNFFLRSAYAGNRIGAWGGQVVVTNKPVTWLPFDHLGKVRILACPHWSWVAHPPTLTQLVEFEGFADLSCNLSSSGFTSPSVRSLDVNVLAHQQWVSSFTLTCCYGMCLQSLISYLCSIISFPNRSVGAYSTLDILPVDYLDLFVRCCTTSFQYLTLRIPIQWA